MNVKLLTQVRDYIARNPEKYNQRELCGTACCVAGTAALIARKVTRAQLVKPGLGTRSSVWNAAQSALRLDDNQAGNLFAMNWEGRFYLSAYMTPEERSRIAVKRINHFIKTRGAK